MKTITTSPIQWATVIYKKTMITLLFFLGANFLFAQSSYLKFGIGYGLPAGSQLLGENLSSTYNLTTGAYSSNEKGIYGSLGTGFVINASYGHFYSKNLGLDLSFQYLIGKTYKSSSSFASVGYNPNTSSTYTSSIGAHGFLFSPAIIFAAGEGSVKPYAKMGFVLGSMKFASESAHNDPFTLQKLETRTEYRGGLSFGFRGGVGLDIGVSKNVNFFTEVTFISMSYYPHESEITKYRENGIEKPDQYKKITYEKEVTTSATSDSSKQLRFAAPFGSVALNVGIKINIAKKAVAEKDTLLK